MSSQEQKILDFLNSGRKKKDCFIKESWAELIERRFREIQSGKMKFVTLKEIMGRARKLEEGFYLTSIK